MARPIRIEFKGAMYHVMCRGKGVCHGGEAACVVIGVGGGVLDDGGGGRWIYYEGMAGWAKEVVPAVV